jgi:hypothetical protein
MWVKVLPADMKKEVYWKEVPDDENNAYVKLRQIVAGDVEIVKTQTLVTKYGYRSDGWPEVVMIVNEQGHLMKLPVNKRASVYYPNDYDLPIRGEAVLVGQQQIFDPEDGPYYTFASMPKKWKVIYDMETVFADNHLGSGITHRRLEDLLLEVADEDVAKMFREVREQAEWGY